MYFSCKQTFIKARGNPLSSPLPFIAICCLDQWLRACMTSLAWDCCLLLTVVPLNTSCMFCSCILMHTTTIQWTGLLDCPLDYCTHQNCLWMETEQDCKVETLRLHPCITQFMLQSQTVSKLPLFAEQLHGCKTWVIKHNLISILMGIVPFMWPSSCCSMQPGTKTI